MESLSLLLLLAVSISYSAASITVLMDSSNCVHLRCEWRGQGKHCKYATRFRQPNQQKTVSDGTYAMYDPLERYNDSEENILARIQARHPVNTFTVVNDVGVGEQCEGRQLWCNSSHMTFVTDDDDVTHKTPSRVFRTRPRLQC